MSASVLAAPADGVDRGGASEHSASAQSASEQTVTGLLERVFGVVERRWRWALALMLLAELLLLLYMGRGLTFFFDDWDFVTHDYGGGLHSLLVAHVGNISIFPVAIYKVMFHLVGIGSYAPYRLMVIVLHLLAAGLIFLLAARRVSKVPALLATALILFLGAAWEDLLWAFQVGYLLSIVGGLGAWVLLERRDRLGDVGAMVCLVVATGSSSLAIPLLVGVAVELAWQRHWRRLWVVAVPILLYLIWYSHYGESQVTGNSLIHAPRFAADLAAAAFGGLAGRTLDWGRPLALLGLAAVVVRLSRPKSVSPRLAGLLTAGAALWMVTAATRSTISTPEASRYLYLGSVVIVLAGVELVRGIGFPPRALGLATVVVGVFVVTGLTPLHDGAEGLRTISVPVKSELGALELAPSAPPTFQIDQQRAPQIQAAAYLHTVRAIGSSPADDPAQIAAASPTARNAADKVLVTLDAVGLDTASHPKPSPLAPAPVILSAVNVSPAQHGSCVELAPQGSSVMTVVATLPRGGVSIGDRGKSPTSLALRRFGEEFDALPVQLPAAGRGVIQIHPDASAVPWQLEISASSPVSICGLIA